jgi:HB1, ASXL, restriction endonuclease HTH domain
MAAYPSNIAQWSIYMSKKKSTKSDSAPKIDGHKAKEFPRIAEAFNKPLPTVVKPAKTAPTKGKRKKVAPENVETAATEVVEAKVAVEVPAEIAPVEPTPAEAVSEAGPTMAPAAEAKPADEPTAPVEGDAKPAEPAAPAEGETKAKRKAKDKEPKVKKVGALNAAARVLEVTGQPMNCVEMIEMMARRGYWSSPNGLTPHATLHAAILPEMKVKGAEARFVKAERGKFARAQKS